MNKQAEQPPSGSGTSSEECNSTEQTAQDFDPAESAEQTIPIGVPVTDAEFRRMKSRAEQPSPPPPSQTPEAEQREADQDPSED